MAKDRIGGGTAATLDLVFHALSDSSRRQILEQLAHGDATVGAVARPLPITAPSVSKHLRVLMSAGLVEQTTRGRERWLRLSPEGFRLATTWLIDYQRFWAEGLDHLERLVARLEETKEQGK